MSSPRHLAALSAAGALITAAVAVPLLATPANAAPYAASGTIALPAPAGNGVTDLDFTRTCPAMPPTQGQQGYVFALPADLAVAGTQVTLTGSDARGLHDLATYVYGADCTYLRTVSDATSSELALTLAAGDTFLSVYTATGNDVAVSLAATPGATPTATPSPTATPTATPTAGSGRTRHAYPETPDDPLFEQDGAGSLFFGGQWGMRKVHAPQAWQQARSTGAGVKVAILDTGLDLGHPEFACDGKVEVVPDADPDADGNALPVDEDGHGTHVAGIVGACTDNGTGVVGVAPDATVMPIQVLSDTADADTLATAIRTAADRGAHVINMSLGFGIADPVLGLSVPASGTAVGYLGGLAQIDSAIEYATSRGVVVVAAAGNESTALCGYPAIAVDVVCVGASDPRDLNSWYGNFPVKDDDEDLTGPGLLAPGGTGVLLCDTSSTEIISTYSRAVDAAEGDCDGLPGYASIQGTSMASPMVAGTAALVYDRIGGVRSAANAKKVVEALTGSAVDLYAPGYDPMSGYGRLDALAAVRYFDAAPEPTPTATPTPVAKATSLTIGTGVPATVQYGDAAALTARLVDETGAAVAGETVTFQLQGADGYREESATTGADGVASRTLVADVVPGEYRVAVGYSGRAGVYGGSSATQPIAVVREDSATRLVVAGTGANRRLTATVSEADDATRRLAGVTVAFYADGKKVGEVVTDATGVATFAPSGAARAARTFEARFAGDVFYLGSSGAA